MVRQHQQFNLPHQQPIQGHHNQHIVNKETYKKSVKQSFQNNAGRTGRNFFETSKISAQNNLYLVNGGSANVKSLHRHKMVDDLKAASFYAEPNFFLSPSPSSVPLPPPHWRQRDQILFGPSLQCMQMTLIIKDMLQVQ